MEKRNLKINYIENNEEEKDKNTYTFVLPDNAYIEKVKIKDKNEKKKEEPKK